MAGGRAVTRSNPGALARLAREMSFAAIVATTRTAQRVRELERQRLPSVVDRPTPWTLRGLQVSPATQSRPFAEVRYAPGYGSGIGPGRYLKPLEFGGLRRHKRFEVSLIAAGIMRPAEYAVPGRGYPLDPYGNVPGKTIVQILSQLRAFGEQGYRANASVATLKRRARKGLGRYFVPPADSSLPRGVYERWGRSAVRMVLRFVRQPSYQPALEFKETASDAARAIYPQEWARAYVAAVERITAGRRGR